MYTQLSLLSDSVNLTIGLDSEIIKDLIAIMPEVTALSVAVMIDNPKSRSITLKQLDDLDLFSKVVPMLKTDQSIALLYLSVVMKYSP